MNDVLAVCFMLLQLPVCLCLCGVESVGMAVPRSCTNTDKNHNYACIARRTISQVEKAIALMYGSKAFLCIGDVWT